MINRELNGKCQANKTFCAIILTFAVVFVTGTAWGFIYEPEGDAITIRNGTRWNNRPLYCYERFSMVWAGEMPSLNGEMGILYVGIERGDRRVLLQHFSERIMRYRPGRVEWEFSDQRFPGLTVTLLGTTLANANGCTARITVEGNQAGDNVIWYFFPPNADSKKRYKVKTSDNAYQFDLDPVKPLTQVQGRLSHPVAKWEQLGYDDREHPDKVCSLSNDFLQGAGLAATVPLVDAQPQFVAIACDDNDPPSFALRILRKNPLDLNSIADPSKAFELGYSRAKDFSERLIIDTPDPYLNAGAPASVASSAGIYVDPTFVHGGSKWRLQLLGWRTMGGAIYYGWLDQVKRAVKFWEKRQVKENGDKVHAEFSANGCQQAGNSRFYGAGFVDYGTFNHYEFQSQFFDEAIRAWRASADPELEKMLKPMLELHLQRCKDCFDPDGDGLYVNYNNTWPNDSIWFNGGAPEQSSYVYYGHRAVADMCRRAGDLAGAQKHNAIADHISKAVNNLLWMPRQGHFASYVESGGHKRQMPDAWIYAQHVPIETGLTTPEQAWKAMFYTEWAMERFILPYGELRQTSNFVPGLWSVRELYPGDNFGMALGYFLAGQAEEGWSLMRGAMIESMYGDGMPKTGYTPDSSALTLRGQSNGVNYICPGGLSHPNGSIDFTDIVSPYTRCLIEGLFGYRPDYPNGVVRMEPSFPSAWDRASVRTPDFDLKFKGNTYTLKLRRPASVRFGLPVRAAKVRGVTVNGKQAPFTVEPWAGYGMLRVETAVTQEATVTVETEGTVDIPTVLTAERSEGTPGYRLELKRIEGDVPRYQFTKVHVTARANPRMLREAPAEATWKAVDIRPLMNGDVRTIFKQRYESPRPDVVCMRIAYDGWAAWTFVHWGIKTPEIGLENVLGEGEMVRNGQLVTPQRAVFTQPEAERNIAFTSLWDNWPAAVTAPVDISGEAAWVLVCGSTTPMQGKIANAVLRFHYADGQQETLDLVPPQNFWSLCRFGGTDYNYQRDGFSLPKQPPLQVQLGTNCRAMVYGWKLRPNTVLKEITLETLSQDVVIGLMGISIMNPK